MAGSAKPAPWWRAIPAPCSGPCGTSVGVAASVGAGAARSMTLPMAQFGGADGVAWRARAALPLSARSARFGARTTCTISGRGLLRSCMRIGTRNASGCAMPRSRSGSHWPPPMPRKCSRMGCPPRRRLTRRYSAGPFAGTACILLPRSLVCACVFGAPRNPSVGPGCDGARRSALSSWLATPGPLPCGNC